MVCHHDWVLVDPSTPARSALPGRAGSGQRGWIHSAKMALFVTFGFCFVSCASLVLPAAGTLFPLSGTFGRVLRERGPLGLAFGVTFSHFLLCT